MSSASFVDEALAGWIEARRALVDEALEGVLPVPPRCPAVIADAMTRVEKNTKSDDLKRQAVELRVRAESGRK